MDRPQPVTRELERDLANIRSLNRRFWQLSPGATFSRRRWLKPNDKARISGCFHRIGRYPRLIVDFCAKGGNVSVQVDAIDQQASTIEIARRRSSDYPEIEFFLRELVRMEANRQPDDIVLCSLTLHHFSEDDAVRVLQEVLRVYPRSTPWSPTLRGDRSRLRRLVFI